MNEQNIELLKLESDFNELNILYEKLIEEVKLGITINDKIIEQEKFEELKKIQKEIQKKLN